MITELSDGPYTVWIVDTFEKRTRNRTLETIEAATKRAHRIAETMRADMAFGCAVHITDGRGEIISAELIQ